MVYLLILPLLLALALACHGYMGRRAMRSVCIEVGGLTLEQLIDIGAKASASVARRMFGGSKSFRYPDGAVGCYTVSRGGVMTFRVEPLPNGSSFRVSASAMTMKGARMRGYMNSETNWGRAKILTNWLCLILGIPRNAWVLLRRRRRALRAIKRAGTAIGPVTSQQRESAEQEPVTPLPEQPHASGRTD